jgi:hypothetical protein
MNRVHTANLIGAVEIAHPAEMMLLPTTAAVVATTGVEEAVTRVELVDMMPEMSERTSEVCEVSARRPAARRMCGLHPGVALPMVVIAHGQAGA